MDSIKWLERHVRCLACGGPKELFRQDEELVCPCGTRYPIVRGAPVLIRADNEVFPPAALVGAASRGTRASRGARATFSVSVSVSVNLARRRVLKEMTAALEGTEGATVLVVGSGGQRARLEEALGGSGVELIHCDVDADADVDCYADAHELPFRDATFDAVVTTAVLEHVLRPERAVAEMARVLKPDGLVYSEMPFMQQVHEGAYDFTRYSLSGHRRLFEAFRKIEAGLVAGPATSLAWSVEHLALSFAGRGRSRTLAKALVRLLLFWLPQVDRLLKNRPAAMDGASCTYFLGRRADAPVSDRAIVEGYVGGQSLRHV